MSTTLISFLGGNKPNGYDKARYQFPDGSIRETEYFALALKDHLQSSDVLEKLILLGTDTSMWDVFSYSHYDDNTQTEVSAIIEEMEAKGKATQESLDKLSKKLSASFKVTTQCILIPYARDSSEQAEILTSLATAVESNGNIVLDVTHGLRHLSMLALIAARYLKHVRHVNIQDVYYGAFELRGDRAAPAPVINLKGMLQMLDWVEALAVYDRSGNYGVFKELFEADGMPAERAAMLASAAYFERSNRAALAAPKISGAFNHIKEHAGALGQLFSKPLSENISWFRSERSDWELALADRYLERSDYMRAIIFMHEAVITREVWMQRGDPNNYGEREETKKRLQRSKYDFRQLKDLRNSMAHGTRAESESDSPRQRKYNEYIDGLLKDEEKLAQKLRELRQNLF